MNLEFKAVNFNSFYLYKEGKGGMIPDLKKNFFNHEKKTLPMASTGRAVPREWESPYNNGEIVLHNFFMNMDGNTTALLIHPHCKCGL